MSEPTGIPPDGNDRQTLDFSIHATIRMRIPVKKRKEARSILGSMIERIKLEDGCLCCRLYLDALEKGTFMLEEIWTDEKSFQVHLRSNEFRNVLLVVEMASTPPDIRFDWVAQSRGIEKVNEISGKKER